MRGGTALHRYREQRRAVRAFIMAFKGLYDDEPAINLVLQPIGLDTADVAILVPVGELLAIRDAVAGLQSTQS